MSAINGAQALDLSGGPRVIIREHRVIVPGDVSLQPGGLILPDCKHHLRLIDIAHGTAWLLPMNQKMVAVLNSAFVAALHPAASEQAA